MVQGTISVKSGGEGVTAVSVLKQICIINQEIYRGMLTSDSGAGKGVV